MLINSHTRTLALAAQNPTVTRFIVCCGRYDMQKEEETPTLPEAELWRVVGHACSLSRDDALCSDVLCIW